MARRFLRAVALFGALSVIIAACGSATPTGEAGTSGGSVVTTSEPVPYGGTVVVAAEQEPDCLDWLGQCAGSQWGSWMAQYATLPMAFRTVVKDGNVSEVPGAVLTGVPKFATQPVETITYNIAPAAVWSDGVPITCADFQYTTDQIK